MGAQKADGGGELRVGDEVPNRFGFDLVTPTEALQRIAERGHIAPGRVFGAIANEDGRPSPIAPVWIGSLPQPRQERRH